MTSPGHSRKYEVQLVAILGLSLGFANFDMFGIGNLMPFIQKAFSLNNTEIGAILSGFWITFACSSYGVGLLSDRLQKPRAILLTSLWLFSIGSVLSGIAPSFATLLLARMIMGVLDAPVYLVPQSIIALESSPERSGMNMGIVQSLGSSVLGGCVAPILLVSLAVHFSWRLGFFTLAIPGAIVALLVSSKTREPEVRQDGSQGMGDDGAESLWGRQLRIFAIRNVWLCGIISCLMVMYVTTTTGFMPLYLIENRHLPPTQMSVVISVLGFSALVLGILLPAASDRLGRKPIIIGASALGAVLPIAGLYYSGSALVLAMLFFIGWAVVGASPLTFATVACESVPSSAMSTAMGGILALSTLVGGVLGPTIAGVIADYFGLGATLLLDLICCVGIGMCALALTETLQRKRPGAISTDKVILCPSETK